MTKTKLYKKWSHWLERIKSGQLQHLLIHRHIYKQLQECLASHVGETGGAEFLEWMVQNYAAYAATTIRRMIERPHPRWRSISLVILLDDMAKNDSVLTRERYRSLYKNSLALKYAERDFNSITRNKRASHLTAARIQRDIKRLERVCAPVKRLVDKVVAHTEHDRRKIGKIRFGELDEAIDILAATYRRYMLLVNAVGSAELFPAAAFDVRPQLERIWPRRADTAKRKYRNE